MRQILVITQVPSPYQAEFFNYLAAALPGVDFVAGYVKHRDAERSWGDAHLAHEHLFLEDSSAARGRLAALGKSAEFVVFGWYLEHNVRRMMAERAGSGKPWAFWGECPGYTGQVAMGRALRRILLRPLHKTDASIWGIGQWAVDAWRSEFGTARVYHNVPYFSDLDRFLESADRRDTQKRARRILYSGALIERKGVDLLAEAFIRVAENNPSIQLLVLGDGPMRHQMKMTLSRFLDRVEFLGFRDWADLPRIYHSADLLCAPSRRDGWGLTVPEGLAAGMPVIATDKMGAAIDLVKPGENGWCVKANSEQALAAALAEAVSMPGEELARMSRAAIESARNHTLKEGARRFIKAIGWGENSPSSIHFRLR